MANRERTVRPLKSEYCVPRIYRITHVITIITASQLHFLVNNNTDLTIRSQYCIKIGRRQVAVLLFTILW